ncbi:MAG: hypothetical protein WDO13_00360 [Verrucomicrobiota bacterium]
MREVLRLDRVAEHLGDGAVDGALVLLDQLAQRRLVALGDAHHQRLVVRVGPSHVCGLHLNIAGFVLDAALHASGPHATGTRLAAQTSSV